MRFHEHLIDLTGAALVPIADQRQPADGKTLPKSSFDPGLSQKVWEELKRTVHEKAVS